MAKRKEKENGVQSAADEMSHPGFGNEFVLFYFYFFLPVRAGQEKSDFLFLFAACSVCFAAYCSACGL